MWFWLIHLVHLLPNGMYDTALLGRLLFEDCALAQPPQASWSRAAAPRLLAVAALAGRDHDVLARPAEEPPDEQQPKKSVTQ